MFPLTIRVQLADLIRADYADGSVSANKRYLAQNIQICFNMETSISTYRAMLSVLSLLVKRS